MKPFEDLLAASAAAHGHLCPGQVIGVRMAMLGCRLIGLDDPTSHDQIKKLIVYVEMDRCAGDAVAHVTGAKLGRRSLKFLDYGIMAATFVNLLTGKAVRVVAREDARDAAADRFPDILDKYEAQREAYKVMPESELFDKAEVIVTIRPEDMPGRPSGKARCCVCGEFIRDRRERRLENKVLCRACAGESYYGFFEEDRYAKKP